MMIRMENEKSVVPYICHGKVHAFGFDITRSAHAFRNRLKRKFKLKGLN
jgi:hypothetical protein